MKFLRNLVAAIAVFAAVCTSALAIEGDWSYVDCLPGDLVVVKATDTRVHSYLTADNGILWMVSQARYAKHPRLAGPADTVFLNQYSFAGGTWNRWISEIWQGVVPFAIPGGQIQAGDVYLSKYTGTPTGSGNVTVTSHLLEYKRNGSVVYTETRTGSAAVTDYNIEVAVVVADVGNGGLWEDFPIPGQSAGTTHKYTWTDKITWDFDARNFLYSPWLSARGYNTGENTPNAQQNVLMQIFDFGTVSPAWQTLEVVSPAIQSLQKGTTSYYLFLEPRMYVFIQA